MFGVKSILSGFLIFLTLLIIFSLTYNNPQKIEEFVFNENMGIFNINSNNDTIIKDKNEDFLVEEEMYLDNITYLDQIYFYEKGEVKYNSIKTNSNIELNLGKGLYYLNLNDFRYDYVINHESFQIRPESLGKFFIDTRNYPLMTFFSFDSVFNLDLVSEGNTINSLLVYPHMRIGLIGTRYRAASGVNLMRMNDLFNIGYIGGSLFSRSGELNSNILDSIISLDDEEFIDFISKVYSIMSPSLNKNVNYDFLVNSNFLFFGIKYIQEYFNLFLNESKKVVYLKNVLLEDINNVIRKNDLTDNFKKNFKNDLENLRKISEEDYNSIINVLMTYYNGLIEQNSIEHFDIIMYLSKIISELNDEFTNKIDSESYVFLSQLYDLLNKGLLNPNEFQGEFVSFLKYFILERGVILSNEKNIIDFSNNINLNLEFLSLFLRNIIINNLSFEDITSVGDFLFINNFYYSLNNSINYSDNSRRAESLIIEYNSLLELIISEIRHTLFLENRNERGLLELNRNNSFQRGQLSQFNLMIQTYFNFFDRNKNNISNRNEIYINFYEDYKNKYNEYYLALNDYERYVIDYDKITDSLFSTRTVADSNGNSILNEKDIIDYLSKFIGLDMSSNDFYVEVFEDYFRINNLPIDKKIFSFNIYPYDFHFTDNFIIDGVKENMAYELDSIKLDWEDRYNAAPPEERDRFDFARFFINTFKEDSIRTNRKEFVFEEEQNETIDRNLAVFIRDRLLNKRSGEFSPVLNSGILDIKFNNIGLDIKGDSYDIELSDVELRTRVELGDRNEQLVGIFNSDYVFSQNEHYFENIKIHIYDMNRLQRGDREFDFGGNKIEISNQIDILEFDDTINDILSDVYGSRSVYNDIDNVFGINDISIRVLKTGILSYKFDYSGQNIEILIFRGEVNKVIVDGENTIDGRTIPFRQLTPFLNRIK